MERMKVCVMWGCLGDRSHWDNLASAEDPIVWASIWKRLKKVWENTNKVLEVSDVQRCRFTVKTK